MEKKKRPIDDENLEQVTGGIGETDETVKYCFCAVPDFGEDGQSELCLKCGGIRAIISKNLTAHF